MKFLQSGLFWAIIISLAVILFLIYFVKKSRSGKNTSNGGVKKNPGDGCPSFTGLDKSGNPCPSKGADRIL